MALPSYVTFLLNVIQQLDLTTDAALDARVAGLVDELDLATSRTVAASGGAWTDLDAVDGGLPIALDVRDTALNRPVLNGWIWNGWHIPSPSGSAVQVLTSKSNPPRMYMRSLTGGGWTPWVRIVDPAVLDARVAGLVNELDLATDAELAAALDARVAQLPDELNLVQAYPAQPVTYSSQPDVVMRWTHKTLNDPYADTYSDVEEGTWSGNLRRRARVPLLTPDGKLRSGQVPDEFSTLQQVRTMVLAALEGYATGEQLEAALNALPVSGSDLFAPVFRARLARARTLAEPLAVVFTGSSTTAANPGYIAALVGNLQSMYPVESPTTPEWSLSATFTAHTEPGLHGYSAGHGGTTAADYLTDAECDRIAELSPALILHMVGANDYLQQVDPAIYRQNLVNRLNYLDGVLELPCQHVLVHPYQPGSVADRGIPFSRYGGVMRELAAGRRDTAFADLSAAYAAVPATGPGADPLDLISTDRVHQTPNGYALMADLLTNTITK